MTIDETKLLSERRTSRRYQIRLDVDYRSDETYLFSQSENLSEMGVFIVSDQPVARGTHIDLRFNPPGGGAPIDVSGEVVWIEERDGTGQYGMGIQFINPSPTVRGMVKALIRTVAYLE